MSFPKPAGLAKFDETLSALKTAGESGAGGNSPLDAELMIMPEVERLPAILRGAAEVTVYLKLPEDFVRTWTAGGNALSPAMPHFQVGSTPNYPTLEVLKWLARHHGWGGRMRDPATRPRKVTLASRVK